MSAAPEAPVIPSPLGRGQRATEVFIDELVRQHDGGPRRHSPALSGPESWAQVSSRLDDLDADMRELRARLDSDMRDLEDLGKAITRALDQLSDITTKGDG